MWYEMCWIVISEYSMWFHLCVWEFKHVCVHRIEMVSIICLWQFQLGPRGDRETNPSSNNSEGWLYTAVIIASLKTKSTPLPPPSLCILEGTCVCLSLLLSTASSTVAETRESPAARVPRGGEPPCQAWLKWRLISRQRTGVVSL